MPYYPDRQHPFSLRSQNPSRAIHADADESFRGSIAYPVTFVGTFNMFFSDGKTDAGMPQRVQAAENSNLRRASPLWLLEDESEMSGS